jgi:hypothetical protein
MDERGTVAAVHQLAADHDAVAGADCNPGREVEIGHHLDIAAAPGANLERLVTRVGTRRRQASRRAGDRSRKLDVHRPLSSRVALVTARAAA